MSLTLSIYTPNGVILNSLNCDDLKIPTSLGQINVLPGHTHLVSQLDTGVLEAKTDMGVRKFSITAGLCKVLADKVMILSTTSEKAEDIDMDRARSAKAKAESRLASKEHMNDVEMIKYRRKLRRADLRLKLAKESQSN